MAPLATISCRVLKRQRQITAPHEPKNIPSPPRPPPTLEEEKGEPGRNNLLFRVLSKEREGCLLLYLCQCDRCHCFSELFCSVAEQRLTNVGRGTAGEAWHIINTCGKQEADSLELISHRKLFQASISLNTVIMLS